MSSRSQRAVEISDALDDSDQLGSFVSVASGELDEVTGTCHDHPALSLTGDRDAAAAAKLEQSFVSEGAQGPQHGIGVHADHGRPWMG